MSSTISIVYVEDSSDKTITGAWYFDRDNGGVISLPFGTSFSSSPEANEFFLRSDTMIMYKRNSGNTAWESIGVDASAIDHGTLSGLLDDDHTQYQLRTEKGSVSGYAGLESNSQISDTTHGQRSGGSLHSNATTSIAGFASAADKVKIDGAIQSSEKGAVNGVASLDSGGKVPTAQIPASALPEVHVVADAAARLALTVQEGDEAIQTNDGSHWIYDGSSWHQYPTGTGGVVGPSSATDNAVTRYDGTTGKIVQNSAVTIDDSGNVATSGTVDGRDVSVDGTKLDGIASGATNTPLTSTAPTDVTKSAAVVGTSSEAARSDHKHNITTATPSTLSAGGTNQEGSASTLSRSDHIHQLPTSFPPSGAAGGQLGGTYPNPDVRGVRETSGPTLLTLGSVSDGQLLIRSGSTVIGSDALIPGIVGIIRITQAGAKYSHLTITAACAAAGSGDSIIIGEGTYSESFTVPVNVHVRTAYGTNTVTISGTITLSSGSVLWSLKINIPVGGTGIIIPSGASSIIISQVSFVGLGSGTGISVVSNSNCFLDRLQYISGTITTLIDINSRDVTTINGVLMLGGTITNGIKCDSSDGTGRVQINNYYTNVTNLTNALIIAQSKVFVSGSQFTEKCTTAVKVTNGNSRLDIRATTVCAGTYDLYIDPAIVSGFILSGIVKGSFSKFYAGPGWIAGNNHTSLFVQDGTVDDEASRFFNNVNIGIAQHGKTLSVGEGDVYHSLLKVLTTNSLTSSVNDGGNLTDVTTAAKSVTGSTFTFQGTSSGYSILFTTELENASDKLKFFSIQMIQETAAVVSSGHRHDSFAFEYWDGSAWVEIHSFAIEPDNFYRYANEVFLRASTKEHIRLGINDNLSTFSWTKKTIDSTNAYWMRIRLKQSLTTLPTFQQLKLFPSLTKFSKYGNISFFGKARFKDTIIAAGNIFGESGGIANSLFTVGSGSIPYQWDHNVKNSQFSRNGDAVYIQFPIPKGTCTSCGWTASFTYFADITTQDLNWICSLLPVEVEGVKIADPSNGIVTVPRTESNTETVISKAAQQYVLSNEDQVLNKIKRINFGPFDISNYYEGDIIFLRLEMDNEGLDSSNPTILSFEIVGVKWTFGRQGENS